MSQQRLKKSQSKNTPAPALRHTFQGAALPNGFERSVLHHCTRGLLIALEQDIQRCPALVFWQSTSTGETLLHHAAMSKQVGATNLLLDKGAEVNASDKKGNTPLHRALDNPSPSLLKTLLNRGADPNRRNAAGLTPFMKAVQKEDIASAALLLQTGAQLTLPLPQDAQLVDLCPAGSAMRLFLEEHIRASNINAFLSGIEAPLTLSPRPLTLHPRSKT